MGAQATLAARTQALVDAPLQLRSQREAAEKSKRDRWPNVRLPVCSSLVLLRLTPSVKTTIRIRFTDRTQLEKTFPSTDKIRSVYAFVRSSLQDDVKPIKFILCTKAFHASKGIAHDDRFILDQPPNRDLKVSDLRVRDLTLTQLHLTPSSVLLLRFDDESLNGVIVRDFT
jgi:tether containing UBX domain for GLUT4